MPLPLTIFCAGANYADHAAAMARKQGMPEPADPHEQGLKPWHFIKAARTLADPGATIKATHYAKELDWEIELAAVIGRPAKDVPKEKALSYVAGYIVANDFPPAIAAAGPASNRPRSSRWTGASTRASTAPARSAPGSFRRATSPIRRISGLKLWVNGELKQDSNTHKMLFTLAEQIEQLSINMTLHPGDLILTGTPAGTGAESGEFLKAGDEVKVWIEGIGEFSNRIA